MSAKKSHKFRNWTLGLAAGFLVVATIVGTFSDDEDAASAKPQEKAQTEKPKTDKPEKKSDSDTEQDKPEKKSTPREDLAKALEETDSDDTKVTYDTHRIGVQFKIEQTSIGEKELMRDQIAEIVETVAESDVEGALTVTGTYPMQDEYGNVDEESPVVELTWGADDLAKMNFDNLDPQGVVDVGYGDIHDEFK